jgi:hypothetical protein
LFGRFSSKYRLRKFRKKKVSELWSGGGGMKCDEMFKDKIKGKDAPGW